MPPAYPRLEQQLKGWNRCAAPKPHVVTGGIASRLRASDRVRGQCGTFRGKIDDTVVDLDPDTDHIETSQLGGNPGRGASSSRPLTRGKKSIVPTVEKALEIMESKNKKRKKPE